NGSRPRLCIREPGHDGQHSPQGPLGDKVRGTVTERDRLLRKLAYARDRADRRSRQRDHLVRAVRARDAKIAQLEGYLASRIRFRIVGGLNRLRRYRAQARRRLQGEGAWRW